MPSDTKQVNPPLAPRRTNPTNADLRRTLTDIAEHVTRAEAVIALDHNRPDSDGEARRGGFWAYDFGMLEAHVRFIREALDWLGTR